MTASDTKHATLEQVRSELQDKLFHDVHGYHAKYFPETTTSTESAITNDSLASNLRWNAMLSQPHAQLLEPLEQISTGAEQTSPNSFARLSIDQERGEEFVAVISGHTEIAHSVVPDSSVLVLGALQSKSEELKPDDILLAFCSRAIQVFAARPDRLFLHAFRFWDTYLETWTFDRSGAYRGRALSLEHETKIVGSIITDYLSWTDERLGLNSVLHRDLAGTITLNAESVEQLPSGTLPVDTHALVVHDGLVGPGTSCYKTSLTGELHKRFAVKFTWSSTCEPSECLLLQRVKALGLPGTVRLEGAKHMSTIADLRRGLRFRQPSMEAGKSHSSSGEASTIDPQDDGYASWPEVIARNQHLDLEDLKFECIVTSPLGKALDTFGTLQELLKVLHDVVEALQSLYLKARILHRDVSTNNIIIVRTEYDSSTGVLIDLNVALDLNNPPKRQNLAGTRRVHGCWSGRRR